MNRYFILIVVAAISSAMLARNRVRRQILWFLLCAIIPLLVIAIALFPPVLAKRIKKDIFTVMR